MPARCPTVWAKSSRKHSFNQRECLSQSVFPLVRRLLGFGSVTVSIVLICALNSSSWRSGLPRTYLAPRTEQDQISSVERPRKATRLILPSPPFLFHPRR